MNPSKHTRLILPAIIIALILFLLWRALKLHPNLIPSPFINKPAPHFVLPRLDNPKKLTSNEDFKNHVTLLNVWATWCGICAAEHDMLMQLSQQEGVILYGLNYKDDPNAAKKWLQEYGNPYQLVAVDQTGDTAIDWGVYGTPETFIIDKKGIVRYKQVGAITPDIWQDKIKPLIQSLREEP